MSQSIWDKIKMLVFEATDYTKRGKPRVRKKTRSEEE